MPDDPTNHSEKPGLGAIPLFSRLSPAAIKKIADLMIELSFSAGQAVFLEHEPGTALYIVKSGQVRIWVHDADAHEVTLAELEPGAFFGEMAVIDGGKRSANATATVNTTLHCLRSRDFETFLLERPEAALEVLRSLGSRLRQTNAIVSARATPNANVLHEQSLSKLDRLAVVITTKVGSAGFFLLIFAWTVIWTGYNILASQVTALNWQPFDPFPAFVAYLLMSNVIQILLMPLIMVGQNLQARHAETRAELDFEVNQKAEREVVATLRHLERNTELLLQLMHHLDCQVSDEKLRAIASEKQLIAKLAAVTPEQSRQPS